ncbi:MAG: DUF6544 family protein [Ginsengibacter sp.]
MENQHNTFRGVFLVIILFHALIHFAGFARAFDLERASIIIQNISKIFGIFWLTGGLLFIVSALLFYLKKNVWMFFSITAISLSQYLIMAYWPETKLATVINVIILFGTILAVAEWNFSKKYKKQVQAFLRQQPVAPVDLLTEIDIQHLPVLVKKYLKYTGSVGKPKVKNFKINFFGRLRQDEQSEWMLFTSQQYNFVDASTRLFFLNATMKHLPVSGFHSFKNGKAFMDIRLFSMFRVQYQSGKEMNISETVTFFNDMCCLAPATLIDARIQWMETDGNKVRATFTNNNITVGAWLHFNEDGELINFISEDRYAADSKKMKRIPWSTPLQDYKNLNGYRLASYADAMYHYSNRSFTYGNFYVESVEYNCNEKKSLYSFQAPTAKHQLNFCEI